MDNKSINASCFVPILEKLKEKGYEKKPITEKMIKICIIQVTGSIENRTIQNIFEKMIYVGLLTDYDMGTDQKFYKIDSGL